MSAHERKRPASSALQETLTEAKEVYQHETLPEHKNFGAGLRFRFGKTICDVYPTPKAEKASPLATIRTARSKLSVTGLTAVTTLAEEQGAMQGILVTSPTMGIQIKPDGSYNASYFAPQNQAPPLEQKAPLSLAPGQQTRNEPGEPATTEGEAAKSKEQHQRVKISGFFGKVLDGFPRQTEGDEQRMIYKLLIGNKAAVQDEAGKEKIDWITVTALEPHVVKYLEEHLDTFEKRKTQLRVEGYYQDVEKHLRRSVKKTQEVYALSIHVKEEQ